jgi:hypothetical protein
MTKSILLAFASVLLSVVAAPEPQAYLILASMLGLTTLFAYRRSLGSI